jgi:alpha-1,2-mannosyltransferase
MNVQGSAPLRSRYRWGLVIFAVAILAFGCITELRGAFQHSRKTDAGVYFRAAWAVRVGADIYRVQDDNGWHYHYPPLFAILMAPFADPPAGADRSGMLPYPLALGLWYATGWVCLFAAVHMLAGALEDTASDPGVRNQPRYCERWWALRMLPIMICLLPVGRDLARGQVGTVLLLLICATAAAMHRGQRLRAGLWLAGAICLKIIPALLLLVPLQRRDWRMLSGCLTGLVIGLILIPLAVLGPVKTGDAYRNVVYEILLPGLQADAGGSRGHELTGVSVNSSNSPRAVVHNLLHPNPQTRPKDAAPAARIAHWGCAALLIAWSWMVAGSRRHGRGMGASDPAPDAAGPSSPNPALRNTGDADEPLATTTRQSILSLATLMLVMLIASPVYYPHYFSMATFPVMLLLAFNWENHGYPRVRSGHGRLFVAIVLTHLLTVLPGMWPLRDFGLVLLTTFWLWWACLRELQHCRAAAACTVSPVGAMTRAT